MKLNGTLVFMGYVERTTKEGTLYLSVKMHDEESGNVFDFYVKEASLMQEIQKIKKYSEVNVMIAVSQYKGAINLQLKAIG